MDILEYIFQLINEIGIVNAIFVTLCGVLLKLILNTNKTTTSLLEGNITKILDEMANINKNISETDKTNVTMLNKVTESVQTLGGKVDGVLFFINQSIVNKMLENQKPRKEDDADD